MENGAVVLPEPIEIGGVDMSLIKDFLKAKQKNVQSSQKKRSCF